jgi:hypothetical protein
MIKNELREALHAEGIETRRGQTKDELQEIYDRIFKREEKEPVPFKREEKEPAEIPDQEAEIEKIEQDGQPVIIPKEDNPSPEDVPADKPANEFDELIGKISDSEAPRTPPSTEQPIIRRTRKKVDKKGTAESTYLQGYILLVIVDTAYPFGLSWLNNLMDKKIKVKVEELKLTPQQFKELEPVADQAAQYLEININPVASFFLVSSFMYANNLIMARGNKVIS